MWRCPNCDREFSKSNQSHSCKRVSVGSHFENKEKAKEIFDDLVGRIGENIGKCRIISLPCCVHLYGTYDFLAALPKKDGVEIRFALNRVLETPMLKASVPVSNKMTKHCFDIVSCQELDEEFMGWVKESYHLKDPGR